MGSRLLKSHLYLSISQWYICAGLVEIHLCLQEKESRQGIFQHFLTRDLENEAKITKIQSALSAYLMIYMCKCINNPSIPSVHRVHTVSYATPTPTRSEPKTTCPPMMGVDIIGFWLVDWFWAQRHCETVFQFISDRVPEGRGNKKEMKDERKMSKQPPPHLQKAQ